MYHQPEPLCSMIWFRQLEKIAAGEFRGIEEALRHASHLLQLTPAEFSDVARLATTEMGFETLLEAGDYDAAARCLVVQPNALTVDNTLPTLRATISCPALKRPVHGTGETAALAVLKAWTIYLLALRTQGLADF